MFMGNFHLIACTSFSTQFNYIYIYDEYDYDDFDFSESDIKSKF